MSALRLALPGAAAALAGGVMAAQAASAASAEARRSRKRWPTAEAEQFVDGSAAQGTPRRYSTTRLARKEAGLARELSVALFYEETS